MDKWLVIADDFTGANDTGVQLAKRGIKTQVVLAGKDIKDKAMSYVLDTESRNIDGNQAYTDVTDHMKQVDSISNKIIYKKVDSTLRGNLTDEVKAVDDVYKPELIIFAPAYPAIGRTTIDGIHYVNGKRITQTEFSKDPIKPVIEDNIKKLLQLGYDEEIIHHDLSKIRDNRVDLSKARIHTFDTEDDKDLDIVVSVALKTNKKILWVGSAGMADTILKIKKPLKPSVALIGSMSAVSRSQMVYAKKKGIQILNISISQMLRNNDIQDYIDQAKKIVGSGRDLVITSSYDMDNYIDAMKTGEELGLTKEEIGDTVKEVLGDVCKGVINQDEIAGLFITGGDTAIGFINSTNATGSNIITEVTTGIPLIKLNGGEFDGLKMITKAGAFGDEYTLYYAMEKLKEES